MRGRRLYSRRLEQWPDQRERKLVAEVDGLEQVSVVSRHSDLRVEALRVALEFFWLFNWRDCPESLIERDIQSFLSGSFPRPGW